MKKGFVVILAGFFLLAGVVSIVHADAVDWDKIWTPGGVMVSGPSGTATVEGGGTYHWYKLPGQPGALFPPVGAFMGPTTRSYGENATDGLTFNHDDPNVSPFPKTIQWTYEAQAETGSLPNGVTHNTAQRYNVNDVSAGVQAGFISGFSSTIRSFLPNGSGEITVAAELTNLNTWLNSNYDFSINGPANPANPYYHGWHVVGGVQIDEITLDTEGVASHAIVADVSLDSLVLQGTIDTILYGTTSFSPIVNDKTYYELRVQLAADMVFQNVNPTNGIVAGLPTPLEIGTWINPLDAPVVLDALVDQQAVPIPGSLVLLISGLGGLTVIRRRMLSKS